MGTNIFILGTPLSGDIICEKAKYFYRQLSQNEDFKASPGWLKKFKKRFGIAQSSICEKSFSNNVETVLEPIQVRPKQKIDFVKHSDAVSSFNTCIKWASENKIPSRQVFLLRDLRNKAIKSEMNSKKQKLITDFFRFHKIQ